MKKHGFKGNITALEDYYFGKWQAILKELFAAKKTQGRAIFWQEVFDNNKPVILRKRSSEIEYCMQTFRTKT